MAEGDYDRMYEMTSVRELTDVFNRKISRADFASQVRQVTGRQPFQINELELTQVGSHGNAAYFKVTMGIQVGGSRRIVDLLVEAVYQNAQWSISYPFTPSL